MMDVGTDRHFTWLKGVVATIFVLNVLDGVLTVFWVSSGLAEEANPLMDELLHMSPALFMIGKLSLVALGSVLLWLNRNQPAAVVAIFCLFLVYYCLLLYHLEAFNFRVLDRLVALLA